MNSGMLSNDPINLSYLKDMAGDSPEFMIEMIEMFKSQMPINMADLEKALNNKDWTKVCHFAHKIKPTFAYIGRNDAKEHMQKMETDAKNLVNVEDLALAFKEISAALPFIYKQLDEAKRELENSY